MGTSPALKPSPKAPFFWRFLLKTQVSIPSASVSRWREEEGAGERGAEPSRWIRPSWDSPALLKVINGVISGRRRASRHQRWVIWGALPEEQGPHLPAPLGAAPLLHEGCLGHGGVCISRRTRGTLRPPGTSAEGPGGPRALQEHPRWHSSR